MREGWTGSQCNDFRRGIMFSNFFILVRMPAVSSIQEELAHLPLHTHDINYITSFTIFWSSVNILPPDSCQTQTHLEERPIQCSQAFCRHDGHTEPDYVRTGCFRPTMKTCSLQSSWANLDARVRLEGCSHWLSICWSSSVTFLWPSTLRLCWWGSKLLPFCYNTKNSSMFSKNSF